MPQPSLHLQLCQDFLDAWTSRPGDSLFDPRNPHNRTAFLHGALGPDMGFFPGSDPAFSRVAHRDPSGDLVRMLLEQVTGRPGSCFRVRLGVDVRLDAMVHPLINERAALVFPSRPRSWRSWSTHTFGSRLGWTWPCTVASRTLRDCVCPPCSMSRT